MREDGKAAMGRLNFFPKVRCVRDGGKESKFLLKSSVNISDVRVCDRFEICITSIRCFG
jgi:hypothetical protein